ncbi:hypothetical protein [uncultured Desulfobacter sp.]|uniref:hypothetical protein n=1 Tax=uncultured Desulfobacter sp. TaxID=240139 RepID=UPI0029F45BD8|nr:hypothetical protein [uncultured Desulfobacter sp.]
MDHEFSSISLQESKQRHRRMGPYIGLLIRKRSIDIQIEYMKRYNKELEAKFKKDLDDTDEYYSKEMSKVENNSENVEMYAELRFNDKEAIYEFIRNLRYSSLVNLFSFLESSLNNLCLILRKEMKIVISPEDLRHKGVTRSMIYLKKVCSVDFPSKGNDWQQIEKLNRVRNQIVHEQGVINNKKERPGKTAFNIVNSTIGLSIKNDRQIIVEYDYFPHIIKNIKNLLDIVHEETVKALKKYQDKKHAENKRLLTNK